MKQLTREDLELAFQHLWNELSPYSRNDWKIAVREHARVARAEIEAREAAAKRTDYGPICIFEDAGQRGPYYTVRHTATGLICLSAKSLPAAQAACRALLSQVDDFSVTPFRYIDVRGHDASPSLMAGIVAVRRDVEGTF